MRNVVSHGLEDMIVPFSITSSGAPSLVGVAPDLVYLDGDHSARGFRADLDRIGKFCVLAAC